MNRIRKIIATVSCLILAVSLLAGCKKIEESALPSPSPSEGPSLARHITSLDQFGLTGEIQEEGAFTCAVYYPRL